MIRSSEISVSIGNSSSNDLLGAILFAQEMGNALPSLESEEIEVHDWQLLVLRRHQGLGDSVEAMKLLQRRLLWDDLSCWPSSRSS